MIEQISGLAILVLLVLGIVNRKKKSGKWMIVAALAAFVLAFVVLGWGDVVTGFSEALKD